MNALDILTITIMAVGSLIVWRLKPTAAMAVYLACILLYPEAWSIKLGPLPTLFVGKVLIFPLLLNLVVKARRLETFKINVLDGAVLFLLVGQFIATLTHGSLSQAVADQSHVVATQTLTYFAARLAVNSRRELFSFVKSLAWAAVPLLLIAYYETLTGDFVYVRINEALGGREWVILSHALHGVSQRFGLYRAMASFGVCISLGLLFAGLFPLVMTLRGDPSAPRWRMAILLVLLPLGAIATVSSAPLLAFAVSAAVLAYYPLRKSLPVVLPLAILILVCLQLLGPRWGIPTPSSQSRLLAFSPENADYRLGLIEEAFTGGMHGHWLFGYGYRVGIGVDSPNPDFNWRHDDIVNIYIAQLVRFGLFGLLPFLAVSLLPFFKLAQAAVRGKGPSDPWLVWCFFAFFLGWQIAFCTVSSIYQMSILLYLLIGLMGSLPNLVEVEDEIHDIVLEAEGAA
jgi:hypothetical protein